MIHPLSDVKSNNIGDGTNIWQFCVIFPDAQIGNDCNICANVLIENDVVVGDRVTIKSGVQLWDGIHVEDDVFIGPNVTFSNDKYPRSKQHLNVYPRTKICKGASLGANSTILPGCTIGSYSIVGGGSVVTKDIPPNEIWVGNPARLVRKLDESDT